MKLFGTDGVRGKAGVFLDAITTIKLAMSAGIFFRKNSYTNKIYQRLHQEDRVPDLKLDKQKYDFPVTCTEEK